MDDEAREALEALKSKLGPGATIVILVLKKDESGADIVLEYTGGIFDAMALLDLSKFRLQTKMLDGPGSWGKEMFRS